MSILMLRRYLPIDTGFRGHGKLLHLKKKHENLYDSVIRSLIWLWIECRIRYQDGILHKDADDIELMADWTGEEGKFIAIVTSPKTQFLDKISDNEYHMHNWYKNNPDLNPKRQADIASQNSGNAHKRYHKEDVTRLLENGIEDYRKCRWFKPHLDKNERIAVNIKKIPAQMFLDGQQFYTAQEFIQFFSHTCGSKEKGRFMGLIKSHTKICTSCGKPHVNDQINVCYGCQGIG